MRRNAIVEVAGGLLQGREGPVRSFLGIPYAAPPIGELRWRPPVPAPSWAGVRDATAFGPDSFQEHDIQLRGPGLSEDCLYLNVWTPASTPAAGAPVMVWIHGNGYTRGSGSHRTYDGSALAARGVVVVTVNYRLGLAGFLAHPQLSAESDRGSSGNYGLLDQISALRWVQENIGALGGDRSRVTVFGQSAGATCTHLLMASELTAGLFSQAILHSPGSMRPMADLATAEMAGERLGTIAHLRDLPISALWPLASRLVPAVRRLASPRGMGPIVDGWIVRGDDISNYRETRVRPMPILVGTTENEGRRLTERMPMRSAGEVLAYEQNSFGDAGAVPDMYRPTDDATARAKLDQVVGDTQFNYGAWSIGREMQCLGAPVYRYRFGQPIPGCPVPPTHDDELPYVFGTLAAGNLWRGPIGPEEISGSDLRLSEMMTNAWAAFAHAGVPAAEGLPAWLPATRDETMMLGPHPELRRMPESEGLRSLRAYFGHSDPGRNDPRNWKE